MKGKRYLISHNNEMRIVGFQEYSRMMNRGEIAFLIGDIQHRRASKIEPNSKKRILSLFEENIEYIANKSKTNCVNAFKKLVLRKLK